MSYSRLWKRLLRDKTKRKENVWLICINLFASEQFQSIKLPPIVFFLPWTLFKIYNLVHFQPWEFRLSVWQSPCLVSFSWRFFGTNKALSLSLFFESASVFHQIFNVDNVFHGKSQTSRLNNVLKNLSIAMELTFNPADLVFYLEPYLKYII